MLEDNLVERTSFCLLEIKNIGQTTYVFSVLERI